MTTGWFILFIPLAIAAVMAWKMARIIVVNIAPMLGALRRLGAWRPLSGLRGS